MSKFRNIERRELIKLLILLLSITGITIVTLVILYFMLNPLPIEDGNGG